MIRIKEKKNYWEFKDDKEDTLVLGVREQSIDVGGLGGVLTVGDFENSVVASALLSVLMKNLDLNLKIWKGCAHADWIRCSDSSPD